MDGIEAHRLIRVRINGRGLVCYDVESLYNVLTRKNQETTSREVFSERQLARITQRMKDLYPGREVADLRVDKPSQQNRGPQKKSTSQNPVSKTEVLKKEYTSETPVSKTEVLQKRVPPKTQSAKQRSSKKSDWFTKRRSSELETSQLVWKTFGTPEVASHLF